MNEALIGLGSNIEPRANYLADALQFLSKHQEINIVSKSSIYETAPVGYTEQSHFLNMVIKIETNLSSIDLLRYCQEIELKLGRKRIIENGPRTLDLDILLYNEEKINVVDLTIPHPRLHERAFVLLPLHEVAPELMVPTRGLRVKELLDQLAADEISEVVKWTASEKDKRSSDILR